MVDRQATLASLRARLAAPVVRVQRLETEVPALDRWFGGWPTPGLVELVGRPGSGRLAPILPALAALTRRGRTVVLVDPLRQLHPPGLGLVLDRVLLLRPAGDQAGWAAEQVARSGAVDAVVLLDGPRLGRTALRLGRAGEGGNTAVFVVGEEPEADLPAALRLQIGGWEAGGLRLTCTRARDGRALGERVVDVTPGVGREEAPTAQVLRLPARAVVRPPEPVEVDEPAPAKKRRSGRKRAAEGNVVALFA